MRLSDAFSSITAAYDDWSHILINNSYIRNNHTISWINYEPIEMPSLVHRSDIAMLEGKKQYSFQIIDDGSILQLFYSYRNDDEILVKASLAFYHVGILETTFDKEGNSLLVVDSNIENYDDPLIPWLRIDYSPETKHGPLHHSCHMHFGLFQHARIPISGVPSPRQFIEFIIAMCYPYHYESKRLDKEGEPLNLTSLRNINDSVFPETEGCVFDILPHLRIPRKI